MSDLRIALHPQQRSTSAVMPRFGATLKQSALPDGGHVEVYDDTDNNPVVIVGGARTPFAKMAGSFTDVSALDLLTIAMKGAMNKTGVKADDINNVIMGNIIGNNEQKAFLHRGVGLNLGLRKGTIASEANRLCGTGFEVARLAARDLVNGGDSIILTGGVENMTRTPVVDNRVMLDALNLAKLAGSGLKGKVTALFKKGILKSRKPHTLNPLELGLTDPKIGKIMYQTADELAKRTKISRPMAEMFAVRSQDRAAAVAKSGGFNDEIVHVNQKDLSPDSKLPKGVETVTQDEHIRPGTTMDKLAKLRVLDGKNKEAVHTAGTSSGVVDGAAALILSTANKAKEKGLPTLANFKSVAITGCDPEIMGFGPYRAIKAVLNANNLTLDDVDIVEVNEAFAGQVLGVARKLSEDQNYSFEKLYNKLNPDGGAIALGHPLAASGSRITLHTALALQKQNKKRAIVSACIGGGQGIAALIENPAYKPEKKEA